MSHKIPVTIISGFLGAGKTSLLRHLISHSGGRRLAVIINEFGELGLDRSFIEDCTSETCPSEAVIELANGCICCKVADDFLPTMETLLAQTPPPDYILIETSGLALPKPLIAAFNWPDIKSRITIDGVITVIDGPAVASGRFAEPPPELMAADHDNPLAEVFADQLTAADLVLINKSNGLTADQRQTIQAEIAPHLRAGVKSLSCDHGRVAPEILIGLNSAAEDDLSNRKSVHDGEAEHDHDDFDSLVITLPETAEPEQLLACLKQLAQQHDILRIKGLVAVTNRPRRMVVQGVGERFDSYYDRNWSIDETRKTQLVFIGQKGLDSSALVKALHQ
ncbi:MAG: cobalamin biosynthesis protein CobW [Candidatus Pacebacteria bacterium]|nr:cobalamin biosynthesis protein CobW [Candidatus Paceibacterota bacterium]